MATTTTQATQDAHLKPNWMRWYCVDDETYWNGADANCWLCERPGTIASAPQMTSQHDFGEILFEGLTGPTGIPREEAAFSA